MNTICKYCKNKLRLFNQTHVMCAVRSKESLNKFFIPNFKDGCAHREVVDSVKWTSELRHDQTKWPEWLIELENESDMIWYNTSTQEYEIRTWQGISVVLEGTYLHYSSGRLKSTKRKPL